jgi:hypothetical protein
MNNLATMALRATSETASLVASSRSLALTVATTNCMNIRHEPYKAKLEFTYDYLVEYKPSQGPPDLIGIENAIAYGVAAALDTCNADESPLYAVELASRHEIYKDGRSLVAARYPRS